MSSNKQTMKTGQQDSGAYDVKIHAVHVDGPVIADASVTYNGCFAIRGMKLVKGDDGPYVAMPGYQSARGFVEVCTPNGPDVYGQLTAAVLDAYRQKLAQMRAQSLGDVREARQEAPAREPVSTAVTARINTLRDGAVLADASMDVGGAFTVNGVRVVNSENGLFVSMPSFKTANGYSDACFPCTTEFHEQVKNCVLDAYQQTLAQIYDQTAAAASEQERTGPVMAM